MGSVLIDWDHSSEAGISHSVLGSILLRWDQSSSVEISLLLLRSVLFSWHSSLSDGTSPSVLGPVLGISLSVLGRVSDVEISPHVLGSVLIY